MMRISVFIFFSLSCLMCRPKGSVQSGNLSENNNASDCIQIILKKDDELGKIRNQACRHISLSETIDNYVFDLKALDFSHCPEPFVKAFYDHMDAWIEVKKVSDLYPHSRGEMHDLFDELEIGKDSIEFKILHHNIWDTWKVIENQATKQ